MPPPNSQTPNSQTPNTQQAAAPRPRPGIMDIKPYVPGSEPERAVGDVYKLSANESALGASPRAIEALAQAARAAHLYPDGSATALREALGALHSLDPARIICGAGSDELLQLLPRAYAGPGDTVVQSAHGFLVYAIASKACGAQVRFAPEKNLTADVDALLEAVDETTRLVFLANPNNPTGTYLAEAELRRLREALREDIILVIDAAYAEYIDAPDYSDGAQMVDECPNVVMTRTFSKIYGLGGLRLGWGYFPEDIADVINRIRGPFNVSASAIAAGVAALADQDFVARNRAHNARERAFLTQQLGGMGLEAHPSAGNFLLVRFPDMPGHASGSAAGAIHDFLFERGVAVRRVGAYGLPDYLRISIGSEAANRRLIALLGEKFPA